MQMQAEIETTKEAKPYPSERAMVAAVQMEIHCTLSTKTVDKGLALDNRFPAYDELLSALKHILGDRDGAQDERLFHVAVNRLSLRESEANELLREIYTIAQAAEAKAVGAAS